MRIDFSLVIAMNSLRTKNRDARTYRRPILPPMRRIPVITLVVFGFISLMIIAAELGRITPTRNTDPTSTGPTEPLELDGAAITALRRPAPDTPPDAGSESLRIEFADSVTRAPIHGVTVFGVREDGRMARLALPHDAVSIPQSDSWVGAVSEDYEVILKATDLLSSLARESGRGVAVVYLQRADPIQGSVINAPPALAVDYSLEVQVRYAGSDIRERLLASDPSRRGVDVDQTGRFRFLRRLRAPATLALFARDRLTESTYEIDKQDLGIDQSYLEFDLAVTPFTPPVGNVALQVVFEGSWPHGDFQASLVGLNRQKVRFKQIQGRRDPTQTEWSGVVRDVQEGLYGMELLFSDGLSAFYEVDPFAVRGDTSVTYRILRGANVRVTLTGLEKCDFVSAPARVSAYSQSGVLTRNGYAKSLEQPIALLQGLPAGVYMLEAVASGQGARTKTIRVQDGNDYIEDMTMVEAARAEIHASESDEPRLLKLSNPEFGQRLVKIAPRRSVGRIDVPLGLWTVSGLWPGAPTATLDVGEQGGSVTLRENPSTAPARPTLAIASPRAGEGTSDLRDRVDALLEDQNLSLSVVTSIQPRESQSAVLYWRPGARDLAMSVLPHLRRALGEEHGSELRVAPQLFMETELLLSPPSP